MDFVRKATVQKWYVLTVAMYEGEQTIDRTSGDSSASGVKVTPRTCSDPYMYK